MKLVSFVATVSLVTLNSALSKSVYKSPILNYDNTRDTVDSFVDPNVILREHFEGWGTSLAWWADMVGGMDSEVVEHVVDALFSPLKLNLNIARYVIGGTTPDNYTCGEYRDGGASESYKDGFESPYDWSRDARQRKILEQAKSKGANIFEAFSNSPPQWLTISGCSKGNSRNPPLHSNFDASNADYFADYATEVIKYFHETLNITFNSYSPFNEPFGLKGIGGWTGASQSQEGCNMDRATMVTVIRSVHEAVTAKSLSFLKIGVSDETQLNTQIQSYDYFTDAGVANLFHQVNVHGYWDQLELSRRDLLSMKCNKAGHGLWMDEMGWAGTPADNMEQGLNIANRIVTDLRNTLPSAWVYWQAVEDVGLWGLLSVPYRNTSVDQIQYNSGYYAMEQFSQHIRQGAKLIFISDANSVASFSPDKSQLIIVTVNPSDAEVSHNFDLSLFEPLGSLTLYRTSPTEQHLNLPPPTISAQNTVEINSPPQSISTLEISNVRLSSQVNLVQNGDFELVENVNGTLTPASWSLEGASISDGVTEEDAWRGVYAGVLHTRLNLKTALSQNITIPQQGSASSCSLYLSAWCSSSQAGTTLGINLNGQLVSEADISRNGAYSIYGLSVSAASGDIVQIYFANGGTLLNGIARIDNIFLHLKCTE